MCQIKNILLFLFALVYISIRPVFAHQEIENHGDSPLMMAAYDGDVNKMRQLLERGADINQTNRLGATALYFAAGATRTQAAFKGSTEAVKFLLQHGATVNHKSNINGYTALMAACANHYADSVALLLKYGEDVNALTKDGRSALTIATELLQPEIVALLLDHGARVNGYAENDGMTPLSAAVTASPYINYSSANDTAVTTQQDAAKLANSFKIVRMLLKHSANPNITLKGMANATPLILATQNRNTKIVEMLLDNGASVNAKDLFDKSALDYALLRGPDQLIELLLKAATTK